MTLAHRNPMITALLEQYTGTLVCPECGSHNIEAIREAGFTYTQREDKTGQIIREKGFVQLHDMMIDAECLDCHARPVSFRDGWWED